MHEISYTKVIALDKKTIDNKISSEHARIRKTNYEEGCYEEVCGLRTLNEVCSSKEDAEQLLRNKWNDNDNYSYMVAFKNMPNSLYKLYERLNTEENKLVEYVNKNDISKRKSSTVGCDHCGSKLATRYMKGKTCCPLCGISLMSDTYKTTVDRYETNIRDLKKKIRDTKVERNSKNDKIMYMAFITTDYHS